MYSTKVCTYRIISLCIYLVSLCIGLYLVRIPGSSDVPDYRVQLPYRVPEVAVSLPVSTCVGQGATKSDVPPMIFDGLYHVKKVTLN
jgi:hypothetical protein